MSSSLFAGQQGGAMFADIILPLNLPQALTYGVPTGMQPLLEVGMRVEVSLGRNKLYSGIVARIHSDKPESYEIKPIKNIIDEQPIVNKTQLRFWQWIGHYYAAAPGEVMQSALPSHLKLIGETTLKWMPVHNDVVYEWSNEAYPAAEALEARKELTISDLRALVGSRHLTSVLNELIENEVVEIIDELEPAYRPKTEKVIILNPAYDSEEALHKLFDELARAPKQLDVLMAYTELSMRNKTVRQRDLVERSGATATQIKSLADKGVFKIEERDIDRLQYIGEEVNKEITFTPAQQKAFEELSTGLDEKNVALLQGVTGSGKTLIYIHKIKECIASGKQALFLLPEIGLTTQLVSRLYAYFGEELGVYHSRFSNNERVEIWEKVRTGKYKVVIGPRSALWLPYQELGLIIADEEHDGSYKQKDPSPRFHARDAAIYLASLHKAKTILGSATPSVESLYNAKQGKYSYILLKERYMGVRMPSIQMINAGTLEHLKQQGIKLITPDLYTAIAETLQKGKQVILFQNRRGYAPFQLCTMCGWVPQCKNCAVSLTYHKSTDKLHCHYCGQRSAIVHTCPWCGGNRIQSKSFGTEKIEEEIQTLFPKVRTARMDIDTMRGKQSMQQLLNEVEQHKIDVLIGTQMVVKGLDFAGVSLVGVLSSDSLLSYPDFRVNERAFQLMEQVSGRAGRMDGAGRVIIQGHNLAHPVLQWVKHHDVNAFYEQEIKYRYDFAYPPFTRLIKITFKHKDEPKAIEAAMKVATLMQNVAGVSVQGPVPALVPRIRNQFIQEVWIKCQRDNKVLDKVKQMIITERRNITGERGNNGLQIQIDIDPQ